MARQTESQFATSLIAGLLMIPVSAVAAFALVSNTTSAGPQSPSPTIAAVGSTVVDTTLPPDDHVRFGVHQRPHQHHGHDH